LKCPDIWLILYKSDSCARERLPAIRATLPD